MVYCLCWNLVVYRKWEVHRPSIMTKLKCKFEPGVAQVEQGLNLCYSTWSTSWPLVFFPYHLSQQFLWTLPRSGYKIPPTVPPKNNWPQNDVQKKVEGTLDFNSRCIAAVHKYQECKAAKEPNLSITKVAKKYKIHTTTLSKALQGQQSKLKVQDLNAHISWGKTVILFEWMWYWTETGQPQTWKQVEGFVEEMCWRKYGNPDFKIGKKWLAAFCNQHYEALCMKWSSSHEKALNPTNVSNWLRTVISHFNIKTENIYNMDETGIMFQQTGKIKSYCTLWCQKPEICDGSSLREHVTNCLCWCRWFQPSADSHLQGSFTQFPMGRG